MFLSSEAKNISDAFRGDSSKIRSALRDIFQLSIKSNNNEIGFIRDIAKHMAANVASITPSGHRVVVRNAIVHQKPIVAYYSMGKIVRCELGDLLVTVKYHLPDDTIEAKSIIYQVKLSQPQSDKCDIDQKQLTLLADWPPLTFGKKSTGGPNIYNVFPLMAEFGSYMLELRGAMKPLRVRNSYGISPNSIQVRSQGPAAIFLNRGMYCRSDHSCFFSHLAFEIGESHFSPGIRQLVSALYRYVGLVADPPDEFSEFHDMIDGDGFGVMEFNIFPRGERPQHG